MSIPMNEIIRDSENLCETLTVAELINVLSRYPADTPVCAHWEGQVIPVQANAIELVDDARLFSRAFVDIDVE